MQVNNKKNFRFSPFISKSVFQRSFALLSCWLHVYSESIIFFLFLSILVTFYRYYVGSIAYPALSYIYFVYIPLFSSFQSFILILFYLFLLDLACSFSDYACVCFQLNFEVLTFQSLVIS